MCKERPQGPHSCPLEYERSTYFVGHHRRNWNRRMNSQTQPDTSPNSPRYQICRKETRAPCCSLYEHASGNQTISFDAVQICVWLFEFANMILATIFFASTSIEYSGRCLATVRVPLALHFIPTWNRRRFTDMFWM